MNIRNLALSERPRERLSELGAKALTNSELLAIILGFGSKELSVLELADQILTTYPLKTLANLDLPDLLRIKGVKMAKASKILALFELARRSYASDDKIRFLSANAIFNYVKPNYLFLNYELLTILLLDTNQSLIKALEFKSSSSDRVELDFNTLLEALFKYKAKYFVLVHNHPAGSSKPSKADLKLTKEVQEVALAFKFMLLDHLIIANDSYFSFKDENLLIS